MIGAATILAMPSVDEPFGVAYIEAMAAGGRQIFVVWAPGYQTLGTKCEQIVETLQAPGSGYTLHNLVTLNSTDFYQPMDLYQFTPTDG